MMDFAALLNFNPVLLAFLAALFTWGITALGASLVFFFNTVSRRVLNLMLGFASGVMIAASFWSLLHPAIEMSVQMGMIKWLPALVGFLLGGVFLFGINHLLPHIHIGRSVHQKEGIRTSWERSVLLVLAITLHNIPEGLAIGVAFGALTTYPTMDTLMAALVLSVGIGIQNFPEGMAVAVPLRREGFSRWHAFNYGQMSAIVEPLSALLGAYMITLMQPLLPYALAFAAGAMIFVVVEELIPESQTGEDVEFSTIGAMLGFAIMMWLDVALG